MIIRTLCNTCLQPFELMLEASDLELVKQISDQAGETCPCPRLCGGAILLVMDPTFSQMTNDPRLKNPLRVSGKELFKAVNGAGLPDEIPNDPNVVLAMLKSSPISDASIEVVGKDVLLHELRLQNGVTIHLASGLRGAHVLKMTKEREHARPATDR